MPTSSAYASGLYVPTYTRTNKSHDYPVHSSPEQLNTDFSKIKKIPSKVKSTERGLFCSLSCQVITAVLTTCAIGAAIAVPVAILMTRSAILATTTTTTGTTTTITTGTTMSTTTLNTTSATATTTTTPVCGSTCVSTSTSTLSRVAFYSFDSTTTDATGTYSASGIPSVTYVTGWVGSAVSFTASNAQRLSTAYIPLDSRTFTIDFWFYATDVNSTTNFAFLGECTSQTADLCLFIEIHNQVLFFGFFNDDTAGNATVSANKWYHAAFVFDNSTLKQYIYMNGLLVGRTSSSPLQTTSGAFTIGGATIGGNTNVYVYYSGYIDHLTISYRAKSTCEIYLDAALACYFPFDSSAPLLDYGPNFLTATNTGATSVTGRVNQAWSFTSSLSYILVSGISALLAQYNVFTISMWINPTSVNGGATLIHCASQANGQGICLTMWGLTSSGVVTVNVVNSANSAVSATASSVLPLNTWTHIAQTFSSTNGNRLYIGGVLITTVSASTGTPVGPYVFIGSSPTGSSPCNAGLITTGQFYGSVDEFRVFGLELTATDLCRLAYP